MIVRNCSSVQLVNFIHILFDFALSPHSHEICTLGIFVVLLIWLMFMKICLPKTQQISIASLFKAIKFRPFLGLAKHMGIVRNDFVTAL